VSSLVALIVLFCSLVAILALGLPLAFTMGGIGVIFIYFLWSPAALASVVDKAFGHMQSFIWVAVPLFVFMGLILERSGIVNDLYKSIHQWFGPLRGGLAVGTVVICTVMAAMTGLSGPATVAMGLIALPQMLKRGYSKNIAIGSIQAGGALGTLIPPSIGMIVFGMFAGVSVGKLFAGGVFPGLLLSALFIIYIMVRSYFEKDLAPALPVEERTSFGDKLASTKSMILPMMLIVAVLASILTGFATPSEAAGVGAAGSLLCAAINRKLDWKVLKEALLETTKLCGMLMWIVFGAGAFISLYMITGTSQLIEGLLLGIPGGSWGTLIMMQLILLALGCFLDPMGIIILTVPIFVPIAASLGFDQVWFGVLFIVNMEMAYITPPFGYNLFYMKSVVPKGVTMGDIYRSGIPFVGLQALGLALIMIFPQIVTWLPNQLFQVTG
jgi:tripartite ATP-independent transporter DctM subunit